MRPFSTFTLSTLFLLTLSCLAASDVKINLNEDEMILPPFLVRFDGGPILNITSVSTKGDKRSRALAAKELLEFGDQFRYPARFSLHVIAKERFQWVGGGVFEGKIIGPEVQKDEIPYGVRMDRGWIKVWANEPGGRGVRIQSPNGEFRAVTARFWMHVENGQTEVYLLSGTLQGADGTEILTESMSLDDGPILKITTPRYLRWKSGASAPEMAHEWTLAGLEEKIKAVYPGLLNLSKQAEQDWVDGSSVKLYAELRKKGWRKTTRFAPPEQKK